MGVHDRILELMWTQSCTQLFLTTAFQKMFTIIIFQNREYPRTSFKISRIIILEGEKIRRQVIKKSYSKTFRKTLKYIETVLTWIDGTISRSTQLAFAYRVEFSLLYFWWVSRKQIGSSNLAIKTCRGHKILENLKNIVGKARNWCTEVLDPKQVNGAANFFFLQGGYK